MKTLFAACAALTLVIAAPAFAQDAPAEVKLVDGAYTDKAGKPLYIFTMDTMRNMSHCEGRCAEAWPPLKAPADAKPKGAWYTVKRPDGSNQWAYKDKPLYTYAKDAAGQPATGVSEMWLLAKP